jgi:putative addiction module component (TIGR02574 family)
MNFDQVEEQALRLSPQERARLAHDLLNSIDNLTPEEARSLWLNEAQRRAGQIDSGAPVLVSSDEVSRKARALLR